MFRVFSSFVWLSQFDWWGMSTLPLLVWLYIFSVRVNAPCIVHIAAFISVFKPISSNCLTSDWMCPCICLYARWPEAHHQAETVGFAGRAGRKVRMGPRGSPEFLGLPPPDVGPRLREKSNGCRVPPSFLDRLLVVKKLQSVRAHTLTRPWMLPTGRRRLRSRAWSHGRS